MDAFCILVPSLASNPDFKRNMLRHEDPDDSWIRLQVIGEKFTLNNMDKKLIQRVPFTPLILLLLSPHSAQSTDF